MRLVNQIWQETGGNSKFAEIPTKWDKNVSEFLQNPANSHAYDENDHGVLQHIRKMLVFYTALFQYWSKRFKFNSIAIRILSAALQSPRHTHTFGRRSMDYIPSNYLITLRSTKQSRLSILPKDTNTMALAGLELMV